jgi:hypothetical protein
MHVSEELPISSYLLWDVDPEKVDLDDHAAFLIPRIMERGTMQDVEWAWSYYDQKRLQEILVNAPDLGAKTLSFFAAQFQLPRERFRAYRHAHGRWTS